MSSLASSFTTLVRAESFPHTITWTNRDSFALLLLPLIFINSFILKQFGLSDLMIGQLDAVLRGILFAIVCVLYKDMLYSHWQTFKRAIWRSWLLVLLGAVALQVVVSVTRHFLPLTPTGEVDADAQGIEGIAFLTLLLISLSPLFTALLEDIVFRYTLLHKLFIPHTAWRIVILLLNSILFGLIHFHNFDGNLIATMSFMSAGLFLNLIYLWTRNIWHVLLIHFLNNAVLSLGGVILLKMIEAFS